MDEVTDPVPAAAEPKGVASVAKKIAQVMKEVHALDKSGKNKFHGYKYAPVGAYYDMLRPLMAKRGLVVIPRHAAKPIPIVTESGKVATTGNGTPNFHWHFQMEFDFICTTTGGVITVPFWSQSKDSEDKGPGKALSLGMKYVLGAVFMIDQDDAEADDRDPQEYQQRSTTTKRRSTKKTTTKKKTTKKEPTKSEAELDVEWGDRIAALQDHLKDAKGDALAPAIAKAKERVAKYPPKWRTIADRVVETAEKRLGSLDDSFPAYDDGPPLGMTA